MITYLEGKIIKSGLQGKSFFVDLLISSGIAYRIITLTSVPLSNLNLSSKSKQVGEFSNEGIPYEHSEITNRTGLTSFFTSFQVREDSQTLYGFESEESRDFFEQLISVSGIGPKIGMAVLATYSLEEIKRLIYEGDFKSLSKSPGLGAKGAQKIIVELRGKFNVDPEGNIHTKPGDKNIQLSESELKVKDVKAALKSLGFRSDELQDMGEIAEGVLNINESLTVEQVLQKVLKSR